MNIEFCFILIFKESGALDLALKYLDKNPDGCAVHASQLINDLMSASSDTCSSILTANDNEGIKIICNSLQKSHARPDIASALVHSINAMPSSLLEPFAHAGAPQFILKALQKHPHLNKVKLSESVEYCFPLDAIQSLLKFARFDDAFLDVIKQDDVVKSIAMCMDCNPELAELMDIGAEALALFASQTDLRHNMDIIARSRMEEDSFAKPQITEEAIGIVGNLALIEANANYIVSEGGISIFLSIIAGKINAAKHDRKAAQVLASGIRALGRLIMNDDIAVAFADEGGLQTLRNIVNDISHSQLVMNATIDAMNHLCSNAAGMQFIVESTPKTQIVPLFTTVAKEHPHYGVFIPKFYDFITKYNLLDPSIGFDADGQLIKQGLMEGLRNHMSLNKDKDDQIFRACEFIQHLVTKIPKLTPLLVNMCADCIVKCVSVHKSNMDVLRTIFQMLYVLIEIDPNVIIV